MPTGQVCFFPLFFCQDNSFRYPHCPAVVVRPSGPGSVSFSRFQSLGRWRCLCGLQAPQAQTRSPKCSVLRETLLLINFHLKPVLPFLEVFLGNLSLGYEPFFLCVFLFCFFLFLFGFQLWVFSCLVSRITSWWWFRTTLYCHLWAALFLLTCPSFTYHWSTDVPKPVVLWGLSRPWEASQLCCYLASLMFVLGHMCPITYGLNWV